MYVELTNVGKVFMGVEALILVVGLFYLGQALHHASGMTKTLLFENEPNGKRHYIKGTFNRSALSTSPKYLFHQAQYMRFITLWLAYGMLIVGVGVAFMIADGMSVIHLFEDGPMPPSG